jgi:nucleotidyltransferase/DNA polymerase involved in DNA repair
MFTPPRLSCILVPNLPIQVERQHHPPDVPLLITHPVESDRVLAMSDEAALAGVAVGMALHQAQQILPAALVVEPDETEYHLRHEAVSSALSAYTPRLETVALGEFLMEVSGLNRNDHALALELGATAQAVSALKVQVGVAFGRFTAQQAAHQALPGSATVVPPGQEAAFLAPLPLTVLPGLPGEAQRRLHLLDIHTLGHLTALKKVAFVRQFGAEAFGPQMPWLYDLALGQDARPLNADVPPLRLIRTFTLSEPAANRQRLVNAAGRLSERLSQALARHGYQAEALKLSALNVSGQEQHAGQSVRPPTADDARLARHTAQLLEQLVFYAPVVSLTLCAYPLRHWTAGAQQLALVSLEGQAKQNRLAEALQLLQHRFGAAVVRIAARLGPPLPLRVRVRLNHQGYPAEFELAGLRRKVLSLDEPWREERRWWAPRPVRRNYFRVLLLDGTFCNLFQDLVSGEWYLDRAWPLL